MLANNKKHYGGKSWDKSRYHRTVWEEQLRLESCLQGKGRFPKITRTKELGIRAERYFTLPTVLRIRQIFLLLWNFPD